MSVSSSWSMLTMNTCWTKCRILQVNYTYQDEKNGSFDLLKNNEVTDETTKNEESVNEFEVGLAKNWFAGPPNLLSVVCVHRYIHMRYHMYGAETSICATST